ncbi:MAG TPA: type II toxin-antitoxin system death-on-curing family toxin [Rhodothermales bacterium]|nr:type II toxin-antitoxin system death-on-curing family toxin [Rhodothermales bacterium]
MTTVPQEPHWLTAAQVRILHSESLRLFGGVPGIRDTNLFESALARPQQLYAYGDDASIFDLAAAYAFGLARNHAFLDGNKRVALLSIRAFLFLNGYRFEPGQVETVTTIENLAAGSVDQAELATWIRNNAVPKPKD